MYKYAIIFGSLLTVLGIGVYAGVAATSEDGASVTALIPAFFGVPILLLGFAARNESYRKHAMHGVAVLALLGFLMPAGRLAMVLARGGEPSLLGTGSLVLMALLSGALLVLCVKSFVDARRAAASGGSAAGEGESGQ